MIALRKYLVPLAEFGGKRDRQENKKVWFLGATSHQHKI
jgi:hypothetical protein